MKKLTAVLACALSALALSSLARAGTPIFGVADDGPKFADDGGASLYAVLKGASLSAVRFAVVWDPSAPEGSTDLPFLRRSLPAAKKAGVKVVLDVYPAKARFLSSSPDAPGQFAEFVGRLVGELRGNDVIAGNEPNQNFFQQPQFNPDCTPASPGLFEQTLALAYDAAKRSDPTTRIFGVGLSPRGNDDCNAPSNVSNSPVRFLKAMGDAYRASGRTTPIMDGFAFHPYPNPNNADDPPTKGYQWPNAGLPNFDRIKQAFFDAFHGTSQPTFEDGLPMYLDETAWQAAVLAALQALYTGTETSKTVDEATQARYYADTIRLVSCDPSVVGLFFFHLIDESQLDRFQSGLLRIDGSQRPVYASVRDTIAGLSCSSPVSWRHATDVIGAKAVFNGVTPTPRSASGAQVAVNVSAEEDATFKAGVFRVSGPRLSSAGKAAISRSLASARGAPTRVAGSSGTVKAYLTSVVRYNAKALTPGWYVYAVQLSAAMNPDRTSSFVSSPFQFGNARR